MSHKHNRLSRSFSLYFVKSFSRHSSARGVITIFMAMSWEVRETLGAKKRSFRRQQHPAECKSRRKCRVQKVQNEPCNWLAAKLTSDEKKNSDGWCTYRRIYVHTFIWQRVESLAEYKEIMGKTNFNCRQS